jgi:cell division septal protein FtsQ
MVWFEDEIIGSGRLGSVKRQTRTQTLNLMKRKTKKGEPHRFYRAAVVLLLPVIIAGLGTLAWYGAKGLGRMLFYGNDRYTITRLQIRDEGAAAHDFIRGEKRIREGTNLFGFNIRKLREEFLARAPSYRSIRITRQLPDTLTIDVVPRVALARVVLGWRNEVVADREGAVFSMAGSTKHLPAVTGYKGPDLQPGAQLDGMAAAAMQVVDVCDTPRLGIFVEEVNISHSRYVVVTARYGGRRCRIDLSWDGMGSQTPESRLNLLRKLGRWVQVMQSEEGLEKTNFDGTYPDRIYAI